MLQRSQLRTRLLIPKPSPDCLAMLDSTGALSSWTFSYHSSNEYASRSNTDLGASGSCCRFTPPTSILCSQSSSTNHLSHAGSTHLMSKFAIKSRLALPMLASSMRCSCIISSHVASVPLEPMQCRSIELRAGSISVSFHFQNASSRSKREVSKRAPASTSHRRDSSPGRCLQSFQVPSASRTYSQSSELPEIRKHRLPSYDLSVPTDVSSLSRSSTSSVKLSYTLLVNAVSSFSDKGSLARCHDCFLLARVHHIHSVHPSMSIFSEHCEPVDLAVSTAPQIFHSPVRSSVPAAFWCGVLWCITLSTAAKKASNYTVVQTLLLRCLHKTRAYRFQVVVKFQRRVYRCICCWELYPLSSPCPSRPLADVWAVPGFRKAMTARGFGVVGSDCLGITMPSTGSSRIRNRDRS